MINLKKPLNLIGKLLLVIMSILITFILLEGVSRVILNPVDFLRPELVEDPILGRIIEPGSGGHDMWGFRNESVPENAQIVTLGDSQTYGVSASANNSWPSILQQISGKSVYKLALGGFSPVQYHYLLTHKAIELHPETVVVGFYYGNDLFDTYRIVSTNQHWEHLKDPDLPVDQRREVSDQIPISLTEERPQPSYVWYVSWYTRRWLARNSVIYILYRTLLELSF